MKQNYGDIFWFAFLITIVFLLSEALFEFNMERGNVVRYVVSNVDLVSEGVSSYNRFLSADLRLRSNFMIDNKRVVDNYESLAQKGLKEVVFDLDHVDVILKSGVVRIYYDGTVGFPDVRLDRLLSYPSQNIQNKSFCQIVLDQYLEDKGQFKKVLVKQRQGVVLQEWMDYMEVRILGLGKILSGCTKEKEDIP